jgi:hypothetical protein
MDTRLTFEDHMQEKVKKANRVLAVIRQSFTYLDDRTFTLLYKALVRPILEYCNQIWHPYLQKHTHLIENVQRRATKLIPGYRDLTYEERLRKLKIPTLAYRRIRGDMIETYKILNNKYDPTVTADLLTMNPRTSRGNNLKLSKKYTRLKTRQNSFTFRITDTWNSLPNNIVTASDTKSFEARLDRHWTNHPLKYQFT